MNHAKDCPLLKTWKTLSHAERHHFCSNYKVWETALESDAEYIIIMEDDTIIPDQAHFMQEVKMVTKCKNWNHLVVDQANFMSWDLSKLNQTASCPKEGKLRLFKQGSNDDD